jgi:hypothetical protein
MIQNILDDRTRKASAPELSRPTGRYPNLAAAIKDFESAREQTLAFVQENKDDLRRYTVKHPFGIFDAYQVLTIMALHPLRHVRQIEAIRQNVEAGTGGKTQTAV